MNNSSHLFLMPSFYGLSTWATALGLFELRLIGWNATAIETDILLWTTLISFVVATVLMAPYFAAWSVSSERQVERLMLPKQMLFLLLLVGMGGIVKYVLDYSAYLGGLTQFFFVLVNKSAEIRWANEEVASVGTQLSYFGWAGIAFAIIGMVRGHVSRWWLLLVGPEFIGNLLFIDRTRPTWIIFLSIAMVTAATPTLKVSTLIKRGIMVIVVFIGLFLGIAQWVGKVSEQGTYGYSALPAPAQNVYFYITSGIPYLDAIVKRQDPVKFVPERSFFPIFKALSKVEMVDTPPKQINDFYMVPFATNVGTYLEPYYRDGGLVFAIAGILLISFGLNMAALALLKHNDPWSLLLWANLCFASFIAFFTPKLVSTPVWLFLVLALISLNFSGCRRVRAGQIVLGREK